MPEFPVPVVVLFGPTASGKTALLERLFLRKKSTECPAVEVVSADSMQVYRGLDIGTAKPPPELRAALPHHLIDILDPREQFNAGEFVRLADEACAAIHGRGALPLVSGGAGFYLKNFIQGQPASPPSDAAARVKLEAELRERGVAALVAELREADPESAARIHPNDSYRLIRALEVVRLTGRPLSSFLTSESRRPNYRFLLIGLEWERDVLYRRINRRCAEMFKAGLAAEVRDLFESALTPRFPALKAIGYNEFFVDDYEGGFRLSSDFEGVESLVSRHSRQYAKRQITWFKQMRGVTWIKFDEDDDSADCGFEAAVELIKKKVNKFLLEEIDGI
jgi:tRNA dimethylallyltransferase